MDILLLNASVLELPTSQRAGAIVYGGTANLGLWRPPGPDRVLSGAYGESLGLTLDDARSRLPDGKLERGETLRLGPGKLRCDFLIWVADRDAHGEVEQAKAPDAATIRESARSAIKYAEERNVTRLAFGALGDGPEALAAEERMVEVVAAAAEHEEACRAAGQSTVLEEVMVCHPSSRAVAQAKRRVGTRAKQATVDRPVAADEKPVKRRATKATGTRKPRAKAPVLDPERLMMARGSAAPYDRTHEYLPGEWLIHPKFGAGQVQMVLAENMVTVLFEDAEQRRLVHAR